MFGMLAIILLLVVKLFILEKNIEELEEDILDIESKIYKEG